MEDEKPHSCPVCGGFEFMKENGYFYCIECQTQCEDMREQVFEENNVDDEDGARMIGTPFIRKKTAKNETNHKGEDLTSWEIFNFILRGLTDELIVAGAPTTLKDTTLQLWAFYLQKMEVAFVSKEEALLPKLGARYRKKDVELLYGLKKRKTKKKSKVSSVNADLNTSVSGLTDWCSMEIKKQWKRKARKALMKKVAESENSILDQSSNLNTSIDDSSSVCSDALSLAESPVSSVRMERTEAAKKWLEKNRRNGDETAYSSYLNPTDLSKFKLMNLLYLALLHEKSSIQISDIVRWIREGHLPYYEAAKHIPENCFVQSLHSLIFSMSVPFPTYTVYLNSARHMAYFLKFVEWSDPDASELAKKYVKELQLPEMFVDLIDRFVTLIPMSYKARVHCKFSVQKEIPNYEGRVLAILIIILKLLFGLDGKTELQISKAASQLNKWMKHKKGEKKVPKLFVWSDWVKQLVCRIAVLSKYHFPTKHILIPTSYGNPYAYINHSKKWNNANAGLFEKYNYSSMNLLRVSHPFLMNIFSSFLGKLQDSTYNEDEDIDFPRSLTPYSLYIKNIIKKSTSAEEPLIPKSAMEVLTEDFSKCDINYLLKPESLSNVTEEYGRHLQIKNRSAQRKFIKFNYQRLGICISRSRQTHVKVIHCHHRMKNRIPPNSDNEEYFTESRKRNNEANRVRMMRLRRKSKYEGVLEDALRIKKKMERQALRDDSQSAVQKVERLKEKMLKAQRKKFGNTTEANSHSSSEPRKRKNQCPPSEKSKKTKLSKMFKLYVPSSEYWVNVDCPKMNNNEFEIHVLRSFPFSFSWLLSECAFISEMPRAMLYKEVVRIEKLCKDFLK